MTLGVAIVLVATLIGCAIGVTWLLRGKLPLYCCPECGSYNVESEILMCGEGEALTCECGHQWKSV